MMLSPGVRRSVVWLWLALASLLLLQVKSGAPYAFAGVALFSMLAAVSFLRADRRAR